MNITVSYLASRLNKEINEKRRKMMLIREIFDYFEIDDNKKHFLPIIVIKNISDNDLNVWYRDKSDNISKQHYSDIDYQKMYENIKNSENTNIDVLSNYIQNLIESYKVLDFKIFSNFIENKKFFKKHIIVETKHFYRKLNVDEVRYKINNVVVIPLINNCKLLQVEPKILNLIKAPVVIENKHKWSKFNWFKKLL